MPGLIIFDRPGLESKKGLGKVVRQGGPTLRADKAKTIVFYEHSAIIINLLVLVFFCTVNRDFSDNDDHICSPVNVFLIDHVGYKTTWMNPRLGQLYLV